MEYSKSADLKFAPRIFGIIVSTTAWLNNKVTCKNECCLAAVGQKKKHGRLLIK